MSFNHGVLEVIQLEREEWEKVRNGGKAKPDFTLHYATFLMLANFPSFPPRAGLRAQAGEL